MTGSVPVPPVSVVIGSNGAPDALHACLNALEPQRDGTEVLVCEPGASSPELRVRFPWARFIELPGALVPALWSEGIRQSKGEIVALTISPMRAAPDWIARILEAHTSYDAVGGAIEPESNLAIPDFAEYLCRYARDMLPFVPHASLDLPGDNATYKRAALEPVAQTYATGFWEPDVHRAMSDQGASLWQSDAVVVRMGASAGARAFVRQRLAHGRAYGHQRGVRFSAARNLAGVLGAPLVPFLMAMRTWRELDRRNRLRRKAIAALPYVALYNVAWAVGEARGHLETLLGIDDPVAGVHR